LGKTPFFCSYTKLAELSKPEIPSMAALKPKNKAVAIPPPLTGKEKLMRKTSVPFLSIKNMELMISRAIEIK